MSIKIIENVDHTIPLEHSQQYATILLDFVLSRYANNININLIRMGNNAPVNQKIDHPRLGPVSILEV
jgi:hypothetical protein